MKSTLILAAISCLLGAGVVMASDSSYSFHNQWITKGYLTIGNTVIVMPDRLKSGDRIEFFGVNGERAMHKVVGQGFLSMNFSNLPSGMYDMVVYRDGEIITEHMVPIAGGTGR